jgi:Tol biopolymer transport system component
MITRRSGVLVAMAAIGSCLLVPLAGTPARAGSSPALLAFDNGSDGTFETPFGSTAQPTEVAPAGIYPQFSPSGAELAYDLERSTNGGDLTNSIVVASRTGGAPHDIITGGTTFDGDKNSVLYPLVWSPDGTEIAYGCDGQQDESDGLVVSEWEQVCVVDVATGKHHMLTDPATDKDPPAGVGLDERWSWTPNGKDIIATVIAAAPCPPDESFPLGCGYAAIGKVDVDSGAVTVLTESGASGSHQTSPTVSPDGEHILYKDWFPAGGGTEGLYLMNIGGGGAHLIDTGGLYPVAGAIFSPDGKDILFSALSTADEYHTQAYLVPIAGSDTAIQVTQGNVSVNDLSWAPTETTCTVPDLKGKTLAKARKLLKQAACTLGKIHGPKSHRSKRHIVKQSPKAKRDEPAGTKVDVKLGKHH